MYIYILDLCTGIRIRDRLFGPEVRVPGYRYKVPRFVSRRYQFFHELVGPRSLINITEDIFE
jgi:hypothetical protein